MSIFSNQEKGMLKSEPNKVTGMQRDFMESIIGKQQNKIEIELNNLKGKEYFTAISRVLELVLTTLQRDRIEKCRHGL